jgi:hypothetical protein
MSKKEQMDVGDEEQVHKHKTKYQLKQEEFDENLRRLLSDKRNRKVLWKFLEATGLLGTVSMQDTHVMAVKSGWRDAGLWWIERMKAVDANAFVLMQYEAIQEDEND